MGGTRAGVLWPGRVISPGARGNQTPSIIRVPINTTPPPCRRRPSRAHHGSGSGVDYRVASASNCDGNGHASRWRAFIEV